MKHIVTVFEHQTLSNADLFIASDFHWLIAKVEANQLPCFTLGVQAGQVVLVVRHYLAVIRLPSGTLLEILPKISKQSATEPQQTRAWVGQMLSDIYGLKHRWLPVLTSSQVTKNKTGQTDLWLQSLIEQWFDVLLALQLPRHYQHTHQNSPQAQGKLLIKQQLQHNAHRPHYRYTSQQQLSLHALWGRFFQTALIKVQSVVIDIPPAVQQAIIHLTQQKPMPLPRSQWQSSHHQLIQMLLTNKVQQNRHMSEQLSQALALAWLILQLDEGQVMMPVLGQQTAPAIMINMHQAFEQWVTTKLTAVYPSRLKQQTRSVWLTTLDDKQQKYLQPDIIINDGMRRGQVRVVADIKYKAINHLNDVSSTDLYQLSGYQRHWQAEQAWLIYPKTECFTQPIYLQTSKAMHAQSIGDMSDSDIGELKIVPFDLATGKVIV